MADKTVVYEIKTNVDTAEVEALNENLAQSADSVEKINKEFVETSKVVNNNVDITNRFNANIKGAEKKVNVLTKGIWSTNTAITGVERGAIKAAENVGVFNKEVIKTHVSIKGIETRVDNINFGTGRWGKGAGKVKSDVKDINSELSDTNEETKKVGKSWLKIEKGAIEGAKNVSMFKNGLVDAKHEMSAINNQVDEINNNLVNMSPTITLFGGKLTSIVMIALRYNQIIRTIGKSWMWLSKVFATSGIGTIITVIGLALAGLIFVIKSIADWFSRFDAILNPLRDMLAGISNIWDTWIDQIGSIFRLLWNLVTLDFSGVAEEFNNISDAMGDAYETGKRYNQVLREAGNNIKELEEQQRALTKAMEETKSNMNDETKSWEDRNVAMEEYIVNLVKIAQVDVGKAAQELERMVATHAKGNARITSSKIAGMKDVAALRKFLSDEDINEDKERSDAIIDAYIDYIKTIEKLKAIPDKADDTRQTQAENRIKSQIDNLKLVGDAAEEELQRTLDANKKFDVDSVASKKAALLVYKDAMVANSKAILAKEIELAGENDTKVRKLRQDHQSTLYGMAKETAEKLKELDDEVLENKKEASMEVITFLQNAADNIDIDGASQESVEAKANIINQIAELEKQMLDDEELTGIERLNRLEEIEDARLAKIKAINDEVDAINQKSSDTKLARAQWEASVIDRITGNTTADEVQLIKDKYKQINDLRVEQADKDLEDGKITKEEHDLMIEELHQEHVDTLLAIDKDYVDAQDSDLEKSIQKAEQTRQAKANLTLASLQGVQAAMSMMSSSFAQEQQKELLAVGDNEAKKDAINRKYFEKQKRMKIAQIQMDAAMAIIATWAGYSSQAQFGAAFAAIQTAFIAGLAIYQTANVIKQTYGKGGKLDGPLHAAGGIQIGQNVEAEGGEWVINRKASRMFDTELAVMNAAGNTDAGSASRPDIIDYTRLAAAMQSKKVYVVSSDMTETQENDVRVTDRVTF